MYSEAHWWQVTLATDAWTIQHDATYCIRCRCIPASIFLVWVLSCMYFVSRSKQALITFFSFSLQFSFVGLVTVDGFTVSWLYSCWLHPLHQTTLRSHFYQMSCKLHVMESVVQLNMLLWKAKLFCLPRLESTWEFLVLTTRWLTCYYWY